MEFNLINREYLKDIDTHAYQYEHKKTKAKLIFFKNTDENKSFSISFKTVPSSHNGIFHILEHSVLCGSEKYPVKEPFVELIKGSFNTFINAMTFPDKTMYPVSSKNDADLKLLMDIYLDAVFNPKLLTNDNILKQEGWHYHLESENDILEYKGVVYNEMKGVYSSVDELVDMHISETLFSDTPYQYSYGGKPEHIVTLTQQEFKNTYKYCYHASNSYIFLYGNLNIDEYLSIIDGYLEKYDYVDYSDYIIQKQQNFTPNIAYKTYPTDKPDNKNYHTVSYIVGSNSDLSSINSINIIDELLLGNSNTDFRKYFIDNNICEDVYSYLQRDKQEVVYSIIFKNVMNEKLSNIQKIYEEKLEEEIKKGFDYDYIQAIINKYIFTIKEEVNKVSSPKGVNYAIRALRNWLYGENPFSQFKYSEIVEALNDNMIKRNYENIAFKYLLNNKKISVVNIKAVTVAKDKVDFVPNINSNSLTEFQVKKFIEDTTQLLDWQNSKDSIEDLKKIKSVDAKIVEIKNPYKDTFFKEKEGTTYAHYETNTNGIVYSNLLFDISSFNEEMLQYASVLSYLLFNLDTVNKTDLEIQKEIDYNLGDIHSNINIFKNDKNKKSKVKFVITAKNLVEKTNKLISILKENTLEVNFSNDKAIYNILLELKLSLESKIKESGHTFINRRLLSYNDLNNYLHELVSGYEFYVFISKLVDNFELEYPVLIEQLQDITLRIFCKNGLIVHATCNKDEYKTFEKHIINYVEELAVNGNHEEYSNIPFNRKENYSEVYHFNTMVNYVGMGFGGLEDYSGALLVLRHIINLDYLWNNIRVKGGAYGAGLSINKFGEVVFWSFRDPNIDSTLDVYSSINKYIRELSLDKETLNKYIVGTLNSFDQLLSPKEKALISLNYHINKTDYSKFDKLVKEIKETTIEDLKNLSILFENNKKNICLLTSETYITNKNKDKISRVVEIQ